MTTNPLVELVASRLAWFARLSACALVVIGVAACESGGGDSSSSADPAASAAMPNATSNTSTPTTTPAPSSSTATPQALGVTYRGEGTFYDANGSGNCSFEPSPNDLMVAAMNTQDYAGSAVCGEFVEITGPKGKVVVRITDRCPECKPGDIDLSAQAFERIAEPVAGRVPIAWQVVAGDVQGPVSYRYKEGSTQFWIAIQVRNHRLPITKLEILPTGSTTWIDTTRMDYNYFVHPTPIAPGPLQARVTALGGATVQNMLPAPQGGLVVGGTAQFP
jgi:expansin